MDGSQGSQVWDDKMILTFAQGASGDQNPLYVWPSTNVMLSRNGNRIPGYNTDHETAKAPLRAPDSKPKPEEGARH